MRKILILLLFFLAAFTFGQTNATFKNLDVRNQTTLRGYNYIYDSTFFKPTGSNIPWWDVTDTLGFVLSVSNPNESQLVKVRLSTLLDSLGIVGSVDSFYVAYGCYDNLDTWVFCSDTIWIDTCFAVDSVSYADTAGYAPQYWTFKSITGVDTLYNNTPPVDSSGVIFLKHDVFTDRWKFQPTNTIFGRSAFGAGTLDSTGATSGRNNTAFGYNALNAIGSSYKNTAVGSNALAKQVNQPSYGNTAVGYNALGLGTAIYSSVAIGADALSSSLTDSYNTAVGGSALLTNAGGNNNTAIGHTSMYNNTTGDYNLALGYESLYNAKINHGTTALGYRAMYYGDASTGAVTTYNVAVGYETMRGSTTATNNTGQYNTAVGYQALDAMTSSSWNTVYGYDAGGGITTGDSNILIGTSAGAQLTTESDRLFIDNTNTTTPLIWGNMRTDSIRLNADVSFVKDLWYEDTYWRDATTSATALAPGANAPALRTIIGGIRGYGYAPAVQNDISYGQVQINHDYKFDTDIEAHMHFMIEATGEAGDTAVFALEYSWADINETFPTSDTLEVLIPCAAITPKQHKLVDFGTITTPGGDNVSSSIIFRLERLQDSPHDTYDGLDEYVIVLDVDYHIQIDAPGSRGETSK